MACGLSCWPFRAGVVCSQLCSPDSLLPATHPTAAVPWAQGWAASVAARPQLTVAPWKAPARHRLKPARCLCGWPAALL